MTITAAICAHNPNAERFRRVLEGLRAQSVLPDDYDLIVVDNASDPPIAERFDFSWHPRVRILREDRLGILYARLRALAEVRSPYLVFIDDDNVLAPDYLEQAAAILDAHPQLGAAGGRMAPEFECEPEPWTQPFLKLLALRDHGEEPVLVSAKQFCASTPRTFPAAAPTTASMALRVEAARVFRDTCEKEKDPIVGRKGRALSSGEDCVLVLTMLENGWNVGYFPALRATHLIPAYRVERDYLARICRESCRDWISVLNRHGMMTKSPVPRLLSKPLMWRSYIAHRAWRGDERYVLWQNHCGEIEGRARLKP